MYRTSSVCTRRVAAYCKAADGFDMRWIASTLRYWGCIDSEDLSCTTVTEVSLAQNAGKSDVCIKFDSASSRRESC